LIHLPHAAPPELVPSARKPHLPRTAIAEILVTAGDLAVHPPLAWPEARNPQLGAEDGEQLAVLAERIDAAFARQEVRRRVFHQVFARSAANTVVRAVRVAARREVVVPTVELVVARPTDQEVRARAAKDLVRP